MLTKSIGAEVGIYALRGLDLIGLAVKSAIDDPEEALQRDPELDRNVGIDDSIWRHSNGYPKVR